jgi:hypothetical protein
MLIFLGFQVMYSCGHDKNLDYLLDDKGCNALSGDRVNRLDLNLKTDSFRKAVKRIKVFLDLDQLVLCMSTYS